jgi:hypothetical protein
MWKKILWLTLGLAASMSAALAYGSYRWQSETNAMHNRLDAGRLPKNVVLGPRKADYEAHQQGLPRIEK